MLEAIAALVIATAALLGSPGPATLSLAAVGAMGGVWRGLPYLFGILSGLLFVIAGAAAGLASLLTQWPQVARFIQVIGAAYILYVAWKIGSASTDSGRSGSAHPGFRDGLILNILNAKAYIVLLALFGQFLLPADRPLAAYLATALVLFVIGIVVDTAWLIGGSLLQRAFRNAQSARVIRVLFALMLVAVTIWMTVNNWKPDVS